MPGPSPSGGGPPRAAPARCTRGAPPRRRPRSPAGGSRRRGPVRRLRPRRDRRSPSGEAGPAAADPAVESRRVAGCCDPRGCDRMFTGRFARRMGTRYRKRGLDKTARAMVALLEQAGVAGATVLEIGGGAGEIQLELLARGATSATNLELSPAYES